MLPTTLLVVLLAVHGAVNASPALAERVDSELDARSSPLCVTVASGTLVTSDVAVGLPDERKKKRAINRMSLSSTSLSMCIVSNKYTVLQMYRLL